MCEYTAGEINTIRKSCLNLVRECNYSQRKNSPEEKPLSKEEAITPKLTHKTRWQFANAKDC